MDHPVDLTLRTALHLGVRPGRPILETYWRRTGDSFFIGCHLQPAPPSMSAQVSPHVPVTANDNHSRVTRSRPTDQPLRLGPDRLSPRLGRGRCQVDEAAKMSAMEASRAASNSASVICTRRPSVSAREKLAMTPGFLASLASASARV